MVDWIINENKGQYWVGEEEVEDQDKPEEEDLRKPKHMLAEAQKKLEMKIMNLEQESSEQQDAIPLGNQPEPSDELKKPQS